MGYLKYVKQLWKNPKKNNKEAYRERLIAWRREPVTIRIQRPTRMDRARALGYKAKQGYVMVRQRVLRGGHKRPSYLGGKRSRNMGQRMALAQNYQSICEQRAQRKHPNLVVLNSYWVAEDGRYKWYEIVMADPSHPVIRKDPRTRWLKDKKHHSRAFRGKTSAGRKHRGLRNKGKGAEKLRPSRKARGY